MIDRPRAARWRRRKLVVFKHANALGNAPAHALFDRVKVGRNIDGEFREIDERLDNFRRPQILRLHRYHRPRQPARGVEIIEKL